MTRASITGRTPRSSAQFGCAPLTPLSGLRYLAYALARSPILVGRTGKVETDALIAIDGRHPPQASLATNAGVFAATADLDAATWRTFYDEYLASVRATDYMQLPTAVCGSQAEFIEYFGLDFALFKYYGTHLDTWLEMLVAFARQGTRLLVVSPLWTRLPPIFEDQPHSPQVESHRPAGPLDAPHAADVWVGEERAPESDVVGY